MRGKRMVVPGWGNKLVRIALGASPRGFILRMTDQAMQGHGGPPPRSPKPD